ncbi:SEL1-like repeat protein [Marinicauda salina]|nr:SEL1-like repeat protein [Marinicauda salina]
MTLGEWLNRVLLEESDPKHDNPDWDDKLSDFPGFGGGGDDGALRAVVGRLAERVESAEQRAADALTGVDRDVSGLSRRLERLEQEREDAGETLETELARERSARDELFERVRRLERAGPGADSEGLRAVETTVGKLAGRLYETERDVRDELDGLVERSERDRQAAERAAKTLSDRLDETERRAREEHTSLRDLLDARDKRTAEALEGLHAATRGVQRRLTAAERATGDAASALEKSYDALEARLKALESHSGEAVTRDQFRRRLENLAGELADAIRTTRADFARQLDAASRQNDPARLEQALAAAEDRLTKAEERQSRILERVAEQVSQLTRAVDQRVERAEQRLESRLGEQEQRRDQRESRADLETRLERVREENTSAVKRMGEEIARLGASLVDRVHKAEARSAEAVEAAGERMARVVETLETKRGDGADEALQARLAASEERTAKRIAEAMESVNARLDATRGETADALSPVQRAMAALADRLEAIEKRDSASTREHAARAEFTETLPSPPGAWSEADDDDAIGAEREAGRVHAFGEIRADYAAPEEPDPDEDEATETRPSGPEREHRSAPGATADADFLASVRESARSRGHADPLAEPAEGRNKWVLVGASTLGFLAMSAAAAMLAVEGFAEEPPAAQAAANADPSATLSQLFADSEADAAHAAPQRVAAAAPETLSDELVTPAAADARIGAAGTEPATLEAAAAGGDPVARYQLALDRLQAGAVEDAAELMRRAAEAGVPEAQRRWAAMLFRGRGVSVDPAAALDWTVRAAENGNVRAMHEAGGLYVNAEATPENQEAAAHWFEQAALHGVRDSQFNLALLYQEGFGVPQSAADAYAWFLIAGRAGDSEAERRAADVRRELSAEQRRAAEAAARGFEPRPVDPEAQGRYPPQPWETPDAELIARAQSLLSRLGYETGPADGDFGPQTREAIVAYQSDEGLERTGSVDAGLIARLERATGR